MKQESVLPKGIPNNELSRRLVGIMTALTGAHPESPAVMRAVDASYRALTWGNGFESAMCPWTEPTEESEYGCRGGK
jgi:hypothetical protein